MGNYGFLLWDQISFEDSYVTFLILMKNYCNPFATAKIIFNDKKLIKICER